MSARPPGFMHLHAAASDTLPREPANPPKALHLHQRAQHAAGQQLAADGAGSRALQVLHIEEIRHHALAHRPQELRGRQGVGVGVL